MKSDILVTTFGRMNPPTISHIKLCKVVYDLASIKNGIPKIYLSKTIDDNKNPFTFALKKQIIESDFKDISIDIKSAKDILDVMILNNALYKEIWFVCGEDRKDEYLKLLNKYNGKLYHYNKIHVYSLNRNDNISSSLARQLVKDGNKNDFMKIVANNINGEQHFKKLRGILVPYDISWDNAQSYLDNINSSGCEKWISKTPY